jgi:hypothetical protein
LQLCCCFAVLRRYFCRRSLPLDILLRHNHRKGLVCQCSEGIALAGQAAVVTLLAS